MAKKKIHIFKNPYFIISIIITIAMFILGFGEIGKIYPHQIPYEIKVYKNPNKNVPDLDFSNPICNGKYKEFVYPDFLKCEFYINYKNSDMLLDEVKLRIHNYKIESEKEISIGRFSSKIDSKKQEYTLILPIKSEGFSDYGLDFIFCSPNGKNCDSLYYTIIPIDPISSNEYTNRQNQKIALLFSLLTLSFAIVFSGMKNVRDILENR